MQLARGCPWGTGYWFSAGPRCSWICSAFFGFPFLPIRINLPNRYAFLSLYAFSPAGRAVTVLSVEFHAVNAKVFHIPER